MSSPVTHIDLYGSDPNALATWYSEIFGWETESFPDYDYTVFRSGGKGIGGGFTKAEDGKPAVVPYAEVKDLQATIDAIVSKGGSLDTPITEVPGVTFAICVDPQGNRIGLALADQE